MKLLIVILCTLIIATNGFAQLSKKEERVFLKAERLYNKKKEFKAIEKLQTILDKHISDSRLWSAMIKFHLSRYMCFLDEKDQEIFADEKVGPENVIVLDSTLGSQLERILNKLVRTAFYQELVQLLEDADKNCESIENICEYIHRMKCLGWEKVMQEKKITTLFEVHQEAISRVEKNNCL